MAPDYTLTVLLPTIGKTLEMETLISTSEAAKEVIVYTLVVPLIFMLFLSFSIDKVWNLYLML